MNNLLKVLTVVVIATALASEASTESLWDRRQSERVNLFRDVQARNVGDTVTVLIQESTDVQNQDERKMDRNSKTGGAFDISTAFGGDFGTLAGDSTFSSGTENSGAYDGSAQYKIDRGFTDRITVTVRRVLPNGNLVVAGSRRHRVAGEVRTLKVSGIVRAVDVRADNTIQSQYIADFHMCYAGDGDESSFTNQGWLGKRVNRWWPF